MEQFECVHVTNEKYVSSKHSYVCKAIYQNKRVVLKVVRNIKRNKFEFQLLLLLDNSLKMYKYWYDSLYIYLIVEQCDGDVLDYCVKHEKLSLQQSLKMISDVTKCLIEMRNLGFAHRDVSLENILMKNGRFILCDFGLSEDLTKHKENEKYFAVGKKFYIAPELFDIKLQTKPYDISKSDVYSLGVCFYNAVTGSSFYINHQQKYNNSIMKTLKKDKHLNLIPRNVKNLMLHMLRSCPNERCDLNFVSENVSKMLF